MNNESSRGAKAYNQLSDFLNGCLFDDMKAFVEASRRDHRTLQQKAFRLMMMVVEDTAKRDSDMRNEDSVRIACEITNRVKDITCLPYI